MPTARVKLILQQPITTAATTTTNTKNKNVNNKSTVHRYYFNV